MKRVKKAHEVATVILLLLRSPNIRDNKAKNLVQLQSWSLKTNLQESQRRKGLEA